MLKGIRILDFSRLLPGPYATCLLADLGAEVIKVEDTAAGDYMRDFEPKVNQDSAYYLSVNRNKESIRINFRRPEGLEIVRRLVRTADVVLESFRPGAMEAWGLGYQQLKEINPDLVFCSMTGFGQTGPFRDKAGHDLNYLSLSGIAEISGIRNGQPVMSGVQIADLSGGMFAVIGILSGLFRREQSGEGCCVDAAMLDGLFSWMSFYVGQHLADRKPLKRGELDLSGGLACYNIYQTADDRYVGLGALEKKFWDAFCKAVSRDDLVSGHLSRAIPGEPVYEELKKLFLSKTLREWEDLLDPADCCFTPILRLDEALSGRHFRERGLETKVDHPTEGVLTQVGLPIKITLPDGQSYSGNDRPKAPPKWGQQTKEILSELGYTEADLAGLKERGII